MVHLIIDGYFVNNMDDTAFDDSMNDGNVVDAIEDIIS